MATVQKVFVGVLGVVMLLGVLITGFPFMIFNDLRLDRFAERVFSHSLPPGTVVVARQARFGLLTGNGNHCDYWASMTLATTSSEEAVRAHYREMGFPPAWYRSPSQKDGRIPAHLDIRKIGANGALEYRIGVIDGGYPPDLDFRCH